MCGIIGMASQSLVEDRSLLQQMRDTMYHRGPDDGGMWWSPDGRVGLAQRRLAIIDLSPAGHQPMSDGSGRLWLIFNGEIYNYQHVRRDLEQRGHRLRSSCDTEVILEAYHAWGLDCLNHLNGMFAFCLYDIERQRLFLARDRAGEKPLYYFHHAGRLIIASELKAMLADPSFPRQLNRTALNYNFAFGYVPGDLCILEGVRKLPQAHAMTYDIESDTVHIWQYWKIPQQDQGATASDEELLTQLEALLRDSVRMRLNADVPVGILLSGGIDSSLVTAMAAQVSSTPVRTFTISFPGAGILNEAPHARMVAEHFGTDHTELPADPATVDLLPELVRQYDEPVFDSSLIPTFLVSRLIRQYATVALGGDGGDELFGGYWHYTWLQKQEQLRRFVPLPLRGMLHALVSTLLPVGAKGRNFLIGMTTDLSLNANLSRRVAYSNTLFDVVSRRRLLAPATTNGIALDSAPEWYKVSKGIAAHSLLQQATAVDFQTYMVDQVLVKVDRASMLTSLEVRAPWLDHHVIEFAFAHVPDTLKAANGERKILTRRLAQRLLPPQMDTTRKQGFAPPLDMWFKGNWGKYIEEVLSEADPQLFNRDMIRTLIANQRRGYNNSERLFALTMFELWRREYQVMV